MEQVLIPKILDINDKMDRIINMLEVKNGNDKKRLDGNIDRGVFV
jgi:hypothetical protein